MRGFFRFGSPVIELVVEGRRIEALLDTMKKSRSPYFPQKLIFLWQVLAGMDLFRDCRIVIERSHDIVEVSKSKQ